MNSIIIIKINIMLQTTEKIDIKKAKYLLKLDAETIANAFYQDKATEEGFIFDKITYSKQIKRWLASIVKGKNTIKYQQKNNIGRSQSLTFSLQKCQANIRSYLCKDLYHDVDMKNSAPSILYYLSQQFEDHQFGNLKKYVKSPQKFRKKFNCDKLDIIMLLFGKQHTTNQNLISLDAEIKILQKLIFEKEIVPEIKKDTCKKTNLYGSYLSKTIHHFENKILLEVTDKYKSKIGSYIYDGFLIEKSVPYIDAIINKINEEINQKYNKYINFCVKEMEDVQHEIIDTSEFLTFENIKTEFEKKYFKINNPPMYGKHFIKDGVKSLTLLSKSDIQDDSASYEFSEVTESKKEEGTKLSNFFKVWVTKKDIRSYEYLDFYPKIGNYPFYNMFEGFQNKPFEGDVSEDDVKIFLDHIKLLTNNDETTFNYLLKYIAHMIQKPEQHNPVAIILKGLQGVGKDALVEIIGKITNTNLIFTTSKMEDVLGQFNIGLKNKLLVVFNEIEGSKSDFANHSKFKDLITVKNLTINEKNMKQYDVRNFARIFLFSNANSPVKIEYSDRRMVVINTGIPNDGAYYDRLYKNLINNDSSISKLHNYLLNLDIDNFDFKTRPYSKAYDIMKDNSISELIIYTNNLIKEIVNNTYDKSEESGFIDFKQLDKNHIFIESNDISLDYSGYLKEGMMNELYNKRSYKQMKAELCNLSGIDHVKICYQYKQMRGYKINTEEALDYIKTAYKLDDEVIETYNI